MGTNLSLVFDLDGVLLDSESDNSWLTRAAEKTLQHFNLDTSQQYIEQMYSKNVFRFKEVSKQIGLDPSVLWPVRNRFYSEEKLKAMKHQIIKPFPDVTQLYKLNGQYELAIISNSPQCVVDFFIEGFGFSDLFSFGIGRGDGLRDIEQMKPHPHLFTRFLEKTSAKTFVYVGDRESDKVFAENTGMKFFRIDRMKKHNTSFYSLADLTEYLVSNKQVFQ